MLFCSVFFYFQITRNNAARSSSMKFISKLFLLILERISHGMDVRGRARPLINTQITAKLFLLILERISHGMDV